MHFTCRKTEHGRGFLLGGCIKARHGKSHFHYNGFRNDVMFLYFQRDSCLLPSDVFYPSWFSYLGERLGKHHHYCHTSVKRTHSKRFKSAKVQQQDFCVVRVKKLFSIQQKIWSPWTNTQGLSQCIWGIVTRQADKQKHSVTLFLASANKQKQPWSFLPYDHCWHLLFIWMLRKKV